MDNADNGTSRRTTIYDLAALAGTSATAVSSVLNGSWRKRRISAGLAERILKLAAEQGYSVNIQASVLRRERSNIIGMIIPKYDNRYFGAIAEHFEAMARAQGLFPVITCTQRDPGLEIEAARELIAYRVDSLISTGATDPDHISALCLAAGVKSINLDLPGKAAPSVISDNFAGARDLTALLLDETDAAFGPGAPLHFVGGRAGDHNTSARIAGFRAAHRDRGIEVADEHILACGYAAEKAQGALERAALSLPCGLFVNSTISLEGVAHWLAGLAPGQANRIRYGVFDWDPFAAMLPQNIGMVRQDVDAMLRVVFAQIASPTPETFGTTLVPCILERNQPA